VLVPVLVLLIVAALWVVLFRRPRRGLAYVDDDDDDEGDESSNDLSSKKKKKRSKRPPTDPMEAWVKGEPFVLVTQTFDRSSTRLPSQPQSAGRNDTSPLVRSPPRTGAAAARKITPITIPARFAGVTTAVRDDGGGAGDDDVSPMGTRSAERTAGPLSSRGRG